MSRSTVVLSAGVAVLVYRSLVGAHPSGFATPRAVSRTAPAEHVPLRPELRSPDFGLPAQRSAASVLR